MPKKEKRPVKPLQKSEKPLRKSVNKTARKSSRSTGGMRKNRVDEQIKILTEKNEILIKDIHHRVKNNMQIISSLLGLQSLHVKDIRDAELFEESQNRVRSIALVHEKLYQSDSLTDIDIRDYITDLVNELTNLYNQSAGSISIAVYADAASLHIDYAVPCALIIYELLSNAYKHAFPGGRSGTIHVHFFVSKETYTLRVSDNGVGLPAGLDHQNTGSLGLSLVNALALQLRGAIQVESAGGTAFTITFRR